ncbi:MAG: MauE/DoxX family redox-associated membrane protein [Chitinophagaceae bacterium]
MKISRLKSLLPELIAGLFVLLYVYTALSKVQEFHRFEVVMKHSPLIKPAASILAWVIPAIELIIAAGLIWPRTRYKALIASTALITVFTFYTAWILLTASNPPCNCGGVIESLTWPQHLVFNATFLTLGIIACLQYHKQLIAINRNSRTPV